MVGGKLMLQDCSHSNKELPVKDACEERTGLQRTGEPGENVSKPEIFIWWPARNTSDFRGEVGYCRSHEEAHLVGEPGA